MSSISVRRGEKKDMPFLVSLIQDWLLTEKSKDGKFMSVSGR